MYFSTRFPWIISIFAVLFFGQAAYAEQAVPYDPAMTAGTVCTLDFAKLRPTQFSVGRWEVEKRAEKISEMRPKRLDAYLEDHVAAVVVGPQGVPYLVDGHHLCCALSKAKIGPSVEVRIQANLSRLDPKLFWEVMRDSGWVYLHDESGRGPFEPDRLPKSVFDLADNPYRSLAWAVRERGGWNKSFTSFAEFRWAEFLRERINIQDYSSFEQAIAKALEICHHPDAKDLPGYISPKE